MKQIDVIKENGEKAGELSLPESYFGTEVNEHAIYYAVNALQTNGRQGNASTKTRSEVRYTNSKPWRQKGTGRARAGTRRSPIWRGGGITFGPMPKDFCVCLPKKVRRTALLSALSAKAAEKDAIVVVENLEFSEPETRRMAEVLKNADAAGSKVLIMSEGHKPVLWKSARNLPKVVLKPFEECNVYDILLADKLVIEKGAIEKLEQKINEGSVRNNKAPAADGEK